MQSHIAKVLYPLSGKPMIFYALDNLAKADFDPIVVVVGYKGKDVKSAVGSYNRKVLFAEQNKPLGTGDALKKGLEKLRGLTGPILAVNGDDSAFYKPGTLKNFLANHKKSRAVVSFIVVHHPSPGNLGVVKEDKSGNVVRIEDYTGETDPALVNAGEYIFDSSWLLKNIDKITKNKKGEYYIIELVNMALREGEEVKAFKVNPDEWFGVNTQEDLLEANRLMRERLNPKK